MKRPWLSDFLSLEAPRKLTREEFTAKYLPQYSTPYRPRSGILMHGTGKNCRVVRTGSGAASAISRREGRINEAFGAYLADYIAAVDAGQWVSDEEAAKLRASFERRAQP